MSLWETMSRYGVYRESIDLDADTGVVILYTKEKLKYVVCMSDTWVGYGIEKGRCCKCGREVIVPGEFYFVKEKYCLLCNPQLPELLNEEILDEHSREVY